MATYSTSKDPRIDNLAIDGLLGVEDSLGYKIHEIEHHLHHVEQTFGNNSGFMAADIPTKFTVIGGDLVHGTELLIHRGDVIESGDPTKKVDLDTFYLVSVSAANKISVVEFLSADAGADITGTVVETTEVYTRTGGDPMVVDNDKVVVTALTNITGPLAYEVYYVTDVVDSTFKLSRTLGGASVALGGSDGTFTIKKLTQSTLSKLWVSAANTTTDSAPIDVSCPRIPCSSYISVRALSESGSTISIGFLLSLHTYEG